MAQTMFLRILPESLRTEVYRRPELKKLELMILIGWVRHQTLQERSEELAAQLMQPERVMSITRQPRETKTREQKQIPELQQQVSALQGGAPPTRDPRGRLPPRGKGGGKGGARARSPSSASRQRDDIRRQFTGCYHCGDANQSRSAIPRTGAPGCPICAEGLRKNNGKLPDKYEGALE